MPNQPKTPNYVVRIPSAERERAEAKAVERGTTLAEVIRAYVKRYGER